MRHAEAGTEDDQLLSIPVEVTDADGDSAQGFIHLLLDDDSPSLSAVGVADALVVDETELGVNASASFADNFVSAYGSDGVGSLTYALGVVSGASGLVDTATGEAVNLGLNGGVVEGRTAGTNQLVFTVSVSAGGVVTLDQVRAVVHPTLDPDEAKTLSAANLVTLTGTIVDKDGDTQSAVVNLGQALSFEDDGPTVSAVIDPDVLDDEGLAYGIDGGTGDLPGANPTSTTGSLGYSAGADGFGSLTLSGPSTLGSEAVTSSWNPLNHTLTISSTRGDLMTVQVTDLATGAYAVTLLKPLLHATPGTEDDIVLNLGYTLTDKDGDSADGSLQITIDDDMPVAFVPEQAVLLNAVTAPVSFDLDADVNIDDNAGADQAASVIFTGITNGQIFSSGSTVYTSGGQPIRLFLDGNDQIVTGRTGPEDGSGPIVFQVTLNPDGSAASASDTYSVQLFAQIDNGAHSDVTLSDLGFATAGNKAFNYIDVAGSTQDILFSGYTRAANNTLTIGTVNSNSTAIGVDNQSMNDGDNLGIDFVNSPTVTGSASNTYDYPSPSGGHYTVNDFTFTIVQKGSGTGVDDIEIWLRAYDADDDDPAGTDTATHFNEIRDVTSQVQISGIKVNGVSVNLGTLQTDGNGGYLLRGLDLNDQITINAVTGYERLEIENARSMDSGPDASLTGDSFDIGMFAFAKTIVFPGTPVSMGFNLRLTDADGDTSTGSLNILLNPAAPPVVLDLNGDGLQFLGIGESGAAFDFDGDGTLEPSAWISGNDGFLVYDQDGNRAVSGAAEIVLTQHHAEARTDLEALRLAFDSNGDLVFDARDAEFGSFGVWQDANENGVADEGEFRSLHEAGISGIGLVSDGQAYTAADGEVLVHGQVHFEFADGSKGVGGDVALGFDNLLPAQDEMLAANEVDLSPLTGGSAAAASEVVNAGFEAGKEGSFDLGDTFADAGAALETGDPGGDVAAVPVTLAPVEDAPPAVA